MSARGGGVAPLAAALALVGCVGTALDDRAGADGSGVAVDAAAANACGGRGALTGRPGEACGACGHLACDGAEALRCVDDGALNACGACGPLPTEQCNDRDDDCDGLVDEGCVRRLVTDRFVSRVRIDGDWAALEVAGAWPTSGQSDPDVLLVQISTGAARSLVAERVARTGAPRPVGVHGVSIDGDDVAWVEDDARDTPSRVVAFDRSTGAYLQHPVRMVASEATAIDARRVVYAESGAAGGLRLWDLARDAVTPIATAGVGPSSPDLSGPWVVFVRGAASASAVVARHLSTAEELELSTSFTGGAHLAPAIDGDTVVWERDEGNRAIDSAVLAFDLARRSARRLSTDLRAVHPRVRGRVVCWSHRPDPTLADTRYTYNPTVTDLDSGRALVLGPRGSDCDVSGRRVSWLAFSTAEAFWRDLLGDEP